MSRQQKDNATDERNKQPGSGGSGGSRPPPSPKDVTFAQIIKSHAILAFYYSVFGVMMALLSDDIQFAFLAWTIVGNAVIASEMSKRGAHHASLLIEDMACGWKFFAMAMLWPVVIYNTKKEN